MEPEHIILGIIIAIFVLHFIWEQTLHFLNRKKMSPEIPTELKGIYNEEQYAKQQAYQKENNRFGIILESISFVVILCMLLFGGFGYLDGIFRQVTDNFIGLPLLYLGSLLLVSQLVSLPFSWYDTFVIEQKYGFNRTTPAVFFLDFIKSLLLSLVLGGILLSLVLLFYQATGQWFWIFAWVIISGISVLFSLFYSEWIVPLFNKQKPLRSGELRQQIETFAWNLGFEIKNIYVIDGSKRSTKANAYFTGWGRKKRIVLYDTLIKELEPDEILGVLAHEMGHNNLKHIRQALIMSVVNTGITLFLLSLFLDSPLLAQSLGGDIPSFHLGLIAFSFLFAPISEITGLLFNYISRQNEYAADAYAAQKGKKDALISGLKKISTQSLSNLNPHPYVVFCLYSHPTLLQRIKKLRIKS